MSNIYIRLPQYVAAFYRGRNPQHVLAENEPVKFCEFSHEYVVLSMGLMIVPAALQLQSHCYSQRSWRNMMRGMMPGGGRCILSRDPDAWLTPREICTLEGEKLSQRRENADYLCIKMPDEVLRGPRVYRTNDTYSLDRMSAKRLDKLLRNEFYHCFVDWIVQDRNFQAEKRIHRTRMETLERFFMYYNIPIGHGHADRETMRRLANRWIREAEVLTNDRVDFAGAIEED